MEVAVPEGAHLSYDLAGFQFSSVGQFDVEGRRPLMPISAACLSFEGLKVAKEAVGLEEPCNGGA